MGGTGQNQTSYSDSSGSDQSAKWRSYPNNFVFNGRKSSGAAYNRGNSGYYYSSSRYSSSDGESGYDLDFFTTRVYPGSFYTRKYEGLGVRCVLDDDN